ncbi:MAG: hypothetical protein OXL96_07325 [Candidatus Poribacteria bacterium]|nr:hypothetical protein [Candidatus Poribacteria bacterium]
MLNFKKASAFLGAVLFLVAGSFFSQNTAVKSVSPYGNLLASTLFVKDAQAAGSWDCGYCDNYTCVHEADYLEVQCRQYSATECHARQAPEDMCSG